MVSRYAFSPVRWLLVVALVLTSLLLAEVELGSAPRALPASSYSLYVPIGKGRGAALESTLATGLRVGANALVVDVRDSSGQIALEGAAASISDATEAAAEQQVDIRRLREFANQHDWWLIARVVVMQDPCLARRHPEWVVRNPDGTAHAAEWTAACGQVVFLSPYQQGVWSYAADIAALAAERGFDEVQLDYVRFPDDQHAIFPGGEQVGNGLRTETIAQGVGLVRARMPRRVALSADVFGRVVLGGDEAIGQDIAKLAPHLDAISPMLYPTLWTPGAIGVESPQDSPYEVISRSLAELSKITRNASRRLIVRPWLQAGEDGSWRGPALTRQKIQAQIQAVADHSLTHWMLWEYTGSFRPEMIEHFPRARER